MKTLLITLAVFGCLAALAWTQLPKTTTIEISVLRDVTDSELAKPDINDLYTLYELDRDKWNGCKFRFSNLSDVSLNYTSEIELLPEQALFSNEIERGAKLDTFRSGLESMLSKASEDSIGRTHSAVYEPIASELEQLSMSKSEKRIMVVYSDLLENNREFSVYRNQNPRNEKPDADAVSREFKIQHLLPSLTGIAVYFIFQPANESEDEAFHFMSGIYQKLLEEKGATVFIKANL